MNAAILLNGSFDVLLLALLRAGNVKWPEDALMKAVEVIQWLITIVFVLSLALGGN